MKKVVVGSLFCSIAFAAGAADMGAVDGLDANGAGGWACTSELPNYQGSVHVYRDDGLFLGAISANLPREQAVTDLCGGNGAHGYAGSFSYPSSALDGNKHDVNLYFIRADGSHFEIPGSPRQVQFGDPPAPPFKLQTVSGCHMFNNPASGTWILKTRNNVCHPRPTDSALTYTWAYLPDVPSGYQMETCEGAIPSGWTMVSSSSSSGNCLLLNSNFVFAPSASYTIRKN